MQAWKVKFDELNGKVYDELTFWDKTLKGKKFVTGDKVFMPS